MYDNTISREADLPCKAWRPLPAEPAEQTGLSNEDYDNCSVESNYDSISLPCERKTPTKPLDPDTKAVTDYDNCSIETNYDSISLPCERRTPAEPLDSDTKAVTGLSIFFPSQWKKYWKRNRIGVLLILTGICLLLSLLLLLANISIFPKLRLLNLISTKEVCDASPAPFNFTELETSVITKLKSLEQQFDEKRKVSLQKIEEQLLTIETKLGRLQNYRAWLKRGTPSIMLKYACVVKEDCRLLAADSKGRNESSRETQSQKDKQGQDSLVSIPPQVWSPDTSWRKFQTNVYYFSDTEESWKMAREKCADRDSDLVVINTKQEQDFVTGTLKQSTWLGLSDTQEEGTWRWVDGSPLGERHWKTGEPNDAGRNGEDCAVLYKEGKWNDIACDSRVKFVCEKEVQ